MGHRTNTLSTYNDSKWERWLVLWISSMRLLSIISPERYTEQLLDERNQGTFSVDMIKGIPEHDVRLYSRINQLGNTHFLKPSQAVNSLQWVCSLGAVLVVYHCGESWLQRLRVAVKRNKGWLAVFWTTVHVCLLLNIYTSLKIIATTCIKGSARNCSYGISAIPVFIALSGIPVIVRFRKFNDYLPPPRMWQLCFPRSCFMLARAYFFLSLWIICFSLTVIPGVHIPYAVLLLSTSYLLYATALAAIYLLLPAAICFTALIYTIDQIFCINPQFRLTVRQGFQQVYRLLIATVTFTGAAAFAASLHLLLFLSKNGQKTQSISATVFSIFSTAFTIVAPWAIRTAVRKMQRILNREWEAIHEEASTTWCSEGNTCAFKTIFNFRSTKCIMFVQCIQISHTSCCIFLHSTCYYTHPVGTTSLSITHSWVLIHSWEDWKCHYSQSTTLKEPTMCYIQCKL